MRAWRLVRRPHTALDGEGARRYGGRWNSPGVAVVYASHTLSLAVLEYLARTESDLLPDDLVQLEIEVPDALSRVTVDLTALPRHWRTDQAITRALGDAWATGGETPLLVVPSVLVPHEQNLLINPRHPQSQVVGPVSRAPFRLDERIVGRRRR
ncbi:MAG: RES domain-containing protein [Gemmatimonadetes bacterium]|nr:RES domain-containing protein [Gemmatimonadota bacterium]MBI2402966.1 RES domain-containing protein [Gemmatimonadota bacterium]